MNTTLKRILCVILALILFLVLFLCIKNSKPANTSKEPDVAVEDTTEDNAADQNNDIYYEEENEGVELEIKKKPADDFVGSWGATSAQALYQYGSVDININNDGTWSGYIAHEDLEGTWKETQDGLHLTSDIMECDLKFTKDDLLVMFYSPNHDDNYLTTVLTAE